MATTTKLNIDKATVRQLFKVVARVADEIDESSFVHGSTKRRLALQPMANASEFYVPNMFKDRIMLNAKGYPDISGWSDIELANNKAGWEALGVVSSSLLSGTKFDHMGNEYLIPQTMAGIEIDCDSDEYQAWYTAFTRFPPAAIFEAQHQISDILNKHFEESIRSTHQKKSYYHATERWRDIKIALMNKLVKVKAYLRSQLSDELCKPITDHKSFIEVRESVELIVSMVEMAYGLSYKSEDHTTALQLIDAQLEKINSQANFAREQDRLEAIRVLHAARVQAGNGHKLDLELLLNQLGGIFKPEEVNPEDETLHAALSAQVRKPNHENRGAAVPDRSGPKKYDGEITLKSLYAELLKMTHTVNDMKSEMGSMRKAMLRSGMSFDHNPQKGKDQAAGNQKGKFAGTAKKKVRTDKVAQRSLVPVTQNHEVSDSDADATPEYGNVAIVNQPSKYVSPRAINAILARLTRQDIERVSRRIDVEEQVGRRLSLDEVEARIAADEGWTDEFLGEPEIQKSSVS
jgi:hypothetical protein